VAAVDATGTLRAGKEGEATLMARMGGRAATATVKVTDPGLPKARLVRASDVTRPGAADVTIVVSYEGPEAVKPEVRGRGDVRVVGPNGFQQFPELVSVDPDGKGRGVTASYCVVPTAGEWGEADRGAYTIEMKGFRVADAKGNYVPEGVLGQFRVLPPAERR
jgi:hypothetical protein